MNDYEYACILYGMLILTIAKAVIMHPNFSFTDLLSRIKTRTQLPSQVQKPFDALGIIFQKEFRNCQKYIENVPDWSGQAVEVNLKESMIDFVISFYK